MQKSALRPLCCVFLALVLHVGHVAIASPSIFEDSGAILKHSFCILVVLQSALACRGGFEGRQPPNPVGLGGGSTPGIRRGAWGAAAPQGGKLLQDGRFFANTGVNMLVENFCHLGVRRIIRMKQL